MRKNIYSNARTSTLVFFVYCYLFVIGTAVKILVDPAKDKLSGNIQSNAKQIAANDLYLFSFTHDSLKKKIVQE